jgi:hypothetical protein
LTVVIDVFRSRYRLISSLVDILGRAKMYDGSRLILPKRLPENKVSIFEKLS